jgi:hypothetical protein
MPQQGIAMKKFVIAAALLTVSASAHAGTYNYDGVTVHVQDGCRSSSCVSVYAPSYGYYYNGGHQAKARRAHKDTSRLASTRKEDAAAASAAEAAETAPAKAPEAAPQALSDSASPK